MGWGCWRRRRHVYSTVSMSSLAALSSLCSTANLSAETSKVCVSPLLVAMLRHTDCPQHTQRRKRELLRSGRWGLVGRGRRGGGADRRLDVGHLAGADDVIDAPVELLHLGEPEARRGGLLPQPLLLLLVRPAQRVAVLLGQAELLQLVGQRGLLDVVARGAAEDEGERGDGGLDVGGRGLLPRRRDLGVVDLAPEQLAHHLHADHLEAHRRLRRGLEG